MCWRERHEQGFDVDLVEKFRRGETLSKTRGGRHGRERAIRPGAVAPALRVEAAKATESTDLDLEGYSFADMSKILPAF